MSDGEILFQLNCARCHTKGWSYYDPNNLDAARRRRRTGAARSGPTSRRLHALQFPGEAGVQEQFDWVALGVPANELYGVRGISSGRMPHFVKHADRGADQGDRRVRARASDAERTSTLQPFDP